MKVKNKQSGFTLVELLVVLGIIGILTATGIGIYGQYRHYQHVKTAALQTQGLIMEAQSLSKAAKDKLNLVFEVRITNSEAKLQVLKLNERVDDFNLGTIPDSQYSIEPVSGKIIEFSSQVKLDSFQFINGSRASLHSIAAVAPTGRLLFDLREPDLRQGNNAKDNLYSYLALPSWQNAESYARITFANKDDDIDYKKTIVVYGISGKVVILGE